eukprot:1143588-Pelagomonas_calceolata.AAC.3
MSTGTALHALPCPMTKNRQETIPLESNEMIHVTWRPRWEAAEMLNKHPDLWTHVEAFEKERQEKPADPKLTMLTSITSPTKALTAISRTISKPGYQLMAVQSAKMLTLTSCPPTLKQTSWQTWQCEIIVRSVDLMKKIQKPTPAARPEYPWKCPRSSPMKLPVPATLSANV